MQKPNHTTLCVRAVITCRDQFLAQVNNRVTPGSLTVMLPGDSVNGGESQLSVLTRVLAEQLGVTLTLGSGNCRLLGGRTYEFSMAEVVRMNFFQIDIDGAVPRNQTPDNVLTVGWMTLVEVRRLIADEGWKVQLGALDALDLALGSAARESDDGAREIGREDAPKGVARDPLPYDAVKKDE